MKSILFVCRANVSRSKTAEAVFSELAEASKLELEVRSAGINVGGFGTQISEELVNSSDRIYVMEEHMKSVLIKKYNAPNEKIVNLNIPDLYQPFESELINVFKNFFIDELDYLSR